MNQKVDYSTAEKLLKESQFNCKVDLIPASLKETYSELVSKNPVLVSRELIVDGRPLIGIEYAPDGKVATVYTTDAKGKRVDFENSAGQESNTAQDIISQRLAKTKEAIHDNGKTVAVERPAPAKKKVIIPRTLDPKLKGVKDSQRI